MATPEDRLATYFDTTQPCAPFSDEQIDSVALLLARCSHTIEKLAERSPRTYIIFRVIGQRDLLQPLLSEGFGDDWFPVTSHGLPGFLEPEVRMSVLETQHIILTKSLDLENGKHCNYDLEEQRPYNVQSYIGSGSFGQVRVIESRVTYKQYALKTIRRRLAFGAQSREIMTVFNAEMKIMKHLQHRHVIRYVGSYTDRYDLGLLMSPVADCDLGAYLEEAYKNRAYHPTLQTFFGCLATALSYLHNKGIKHRDIKPKNVLVHGANVLLADFGISRDHLDTTSGPTTATQRYCSPEVAENEGRNESADVWSLGCVFLEMQSALLGRDLGWVKGYYEKVGAGKTHYHANSRATRQLLEEWSTVANNTQARPLSWIGKMLAMERKLRPTAAEVMNWITAFDTPVAFMYSCNQCCCPSSASEPMRTFEDDVVSTFESTPNSHNQQAQDAAPSTTTKSMVLTLSHSIFNVPGQQTLMTESGVDSSQRGTSSTGTVSPRRRRPRSGTEKADTSTGENLQKSDTINNISRRRIELALDDMERRRQIAPLIGKDTEAGAKPAATTSSTDSKVVEAVDTNPPYTGFNNLPEVKDIIPVAHKKLQGMGGSDAPQLARVPPLWNIGPGSITLYRDQDGFSRGLFKFQVESQALSFEGQVPNIVVYCTHNILNTPQFRFQDRLLDHIETQYYMTQDRFDFLRGKFESSRMARVENYEVPSLLCRYLKCLGIPIVPDEALRKWPLAVERIHPEASSLGSSSSLAEHCLSILDLGRSRHDLLLYLLLYMASYARDTGHKRTKTIKSLTKLYGPYICGRNYQRGHETKILIFLITEVKQILTEMERFDEGEGLRETLVRKVAMREQKQAEREEQRRTDKAMAKPSFFRRICDKVLGRASTT